MRKLYIVRLNDEEQETCLAVVNKLKGTSQKVRRANILIKVDAFLHNKTHLTGTP